MKRLLAVLAISYAGSFAPLPASAAILDVPIGYSDYLFDLNGSTTIVLNIIADIHRDPAICDACQSGYYDRFTVSFFDTNTSVLQSGTYTNYFSFGRYSDSHGIGAGPIWLNAPVNSVMFEVENNLTLFGALNTDAPFLILGDQNISLIPAPVPIPPALPLFVTAVFAMLWRATRQEQAA